MLTFWAKLEQQEDSRIQHKIRIDVSPFFSEMWNRCWRLANKLTNFSAQTTADAIVNTIHVNFKHFTYKISYKYNNVGRIVSEDAIIELFKTLNACLLFITVWKRVL